MRKFILSLAIVFLIVPTLISCEDVTEELEEIEQQGVDPRDVKIPTNGVDPKDVKIPTNG